MLTIRREQLNVLGAMSRAVFQQRVRAYLREFYGSSVAALSDEALETRVDRAVERALRYGLQAEEDVVAFVEWTLLLGEHFDTEPKYTWIRDILEGTDRNGVQKVYLIEIRLQETGVAPVLDESGG